MTKITDIIDQNAIKRILSHSTNPSAEKINQILNKSLKKKGLSLKEIGLLLNVKDKKQLEDIFKTAGKVKNEIYGERLVFFAPLYISSYCVNDCKYCGFHCSNKLPRQKLTLNQVKEQTKILEEMGHKRLLLEFGEDPKQNPIDYVVDVINTIYATKSGKGEIRRLNINIAATTKENYKKLKKAGIGTYQLFQETYHQPTYKKVHKGPKASYSRQLFAHDQAIAGGIDDVGLGVLFGLYDYKFEVMALVSHAKYLDKKYGIGPHTFSVPRWQPADSVNWKPPHYVSPSKLLKIIAILRLAVPYTGMIISTRENEKTRKKAFQIGISQTSAASRTSPGGYSENKDLAQFKTADHRSLDDVVKSILNDNLMPSFCTACYRRGRTGKDFMNLAKPGDIQKFCRPNAILTFKEYLEDYASKEVKKKGEEIILTNLKSIADKKILTETSLRIKEIEKGKRDLYF